MEHIIKYFTNSNKNGVFVFYDSWPTLNNAEKELLKRIEVSCNIANIDFLTITNNGIVNLKSHPLYNFNINEIDKKYIDLVITLHWESPKSTKHMTLSVLWHPLEHYHADFSRLEKVVKSDGFLLSGSSIIDEYFLTNYNKPFFSPFYTTLSNPIEQIIIRDNIKCFYIGINWEKIIKKKSRYVNLLKNLDNENLINIYGPKVLEGKIVWEGYKNYLHEIPFDGVSVIKYINEAGLCLVLNSSEHCKSGIVSMRIFEAICAGVPIIANKNDFLDKHFGNKIFYIDTNNEEQSFIDIKNIIEYIKTNKDEVYKNLQDVRNIFFKKFALHHQLIELKKSIDNYNKNHHSLSFV
jgi:hypothetical protein